MDRPLTETAGASPWPKAAPGWWMLAVFFAAAVLSYTDRFIFSLLVDPVRADLHISDTQVSILQGLAFALIYAFAGLPLGRVADIFPRRAVIISGVAVWSAATVACGLAGSFAQMFVARVAVGIGEAALAPAAVSMIADSFPPARRGVALSVFISGMAIGGGAAITIGGLLVDAASLGVFNALPVVGALPPWRSALVLLGLPGLAVIVLMLTVSEPPRRWSGDGATVAHLPLRQVASSFRARVGILMPLYLAVALLSAGDFSFQNWTPTLLSRRFGLTPIEIGKQLGVLSMITGVVGTLAAGFIGDLRARRHGDRARIAVALAAILLGLAGGAVAFAGTSQQVLICFALWTIAASIATASGITLLQVIIPNEMRGLGVALVSLCNMLIGLGCGTTATALLTDHVYRDSRAVGSSIATVVVPAALIAMTLLYLVRRRLRTALSP